MINQEVSWALPFKYTFSVTKEEFMMQITENLSEVKSELFITMYASRDELVH